MKKSLVLSAISFALMIVLCCTSFASPALVFEEGVLSGDLDLNVSELFVVERGYAVPLAEEDLPAEQKMHHEVGQELWHVNLYLVEKDEIVFVPVLASEDGDEVVSDGILSDVYNKQYCKYTLYTSGIYVIEPVTQNTDASVLDGSDEDALYSATADKNVKFNKVDGAPDTYALENAEIDSLVVLDENTLIYSWQYNESDNSYELVIFDKDMFADLPEGEYANINYVVKNNPDPDAADTLLYMISYKADITAGNMYIVSYSMAGIDENGKYRNYYDVFNLYTGAKETELVGSTVADSALELPAALDSGLVVTVKNGVVDETSAPIGKIDTSDSSKGLVWISGYDAENSTISVVPTYVTENTCCKDGYVASLASYSFDAENPDVNFDGNEYVADEAGKVNYKLTDNTVVSVLEYKNAGADTTKWGTMTLGSLSDIASGNKNYKCYYDKALDSNGSYTTKYASNVAAYVYGTEVTGGVVEAEFVLVIVNELNSNQLGMLNMAEACDTHKDPCTIQDIRVYVNAEDDLAEIPAETINIEMTVNNNHHTGSALYMLCTYDEQGVLINAYIKTSTVSAGETDTLTAENIANADGKIKSVKAFVFDTTKVLSPLAKAIEK